MKRKTIAVRELHSFMGQPGREKTVKKIMDNNPHLAVKFNNLRGSTVKEQLDHLELYFKKTITLNYPEPPPKVAKKAIRKVKTK